MSSNKNFQNNFALKFSNRLQIIFSLFILICILILIIPSCSKEKKEEQEPTLSVDDSANVNTEVRKLLGDNLKIVITGNFDEDALQELVAGIELTENNNWGIKFILFEIENNQLVKKFETALLDGSFKESLVTKIKLPKFYHDLIYYDSQDYYWGSGGGEVFSYVVNFATGETYYAHLFSESRGPIELFLSKNITEPDLKKFFVSNFKKDYPNLRLASEDVSLEF